MDASFLLSLFMNTATLALKIAAPILIGAVTIGLMVSLFQALTQINEATLTFLPKLLVMGVVLYFMTPWVVHELVSFTTQMMHLVAGAAQ